MGRKSKYWNTFKVSFAFRKSWVFLKEFLAWFLINCFICVLPVGVTWVWAGDLNTNVFLGFVSWSFSLLMGSFYVYLKISPPELVVLALTMAFTSLTIILYCLYPGLINDGSNPLGTFLETKKDYIIVSLLVSTLVLSFILNKDAVNQERREEEKKEPFRQAQSTKNQFESFEELLS